MAIYAGMFALTRSLGTAALVIGSLTATAFCGVVLLTNRENLTRVISGYFWGCAGALFGYCGGRIGFSSDSDFHALQLMGSLQWMIALAILGWIFGGVLSRHLRP